jgi:hypothetical protein
VEDILIDTAVAPRLKADVIGPWGLAALVIGVTSPAIGLYATWGPIAAPFRTGRSIVIVCVALFAFLLLAAACVRLFRRDLLAGSAPIGVAATA